MDGGQRRLEGVVAPEYGNMPGLPDMRLAHGAFSTDLRVASLLVQQAEAADVLLINKTDTIDADGLARLTSLLGVLNPRAHILSTERSVVEPREVLRTGRAKVWLCQLDATHAPITSAAAAGRTLPPPEQLEEAREQEQQSSLTPAARGATAEKGAEGSNDSVPLPAALAAVINREESARMTGAANPFSIVDMCLNTKGASDMVPVLSSASQDGGKWACYRVDSETGDTGPSQGSKYGFWSFVYTRKEAFDRAALTSLLDAAQASAPVVPSWLTGVLRSKGICLLADAMESSFVWSQAGLAFEVVQGSAWGPTSPTGEDAAAAAATASARQELIFIGNDAMDATVITAQLDSCLVSEVDKVEDSSAPSGGAEESTAGEDDELASGLFALRRHSPAWVRLKVASTSVAELREAANEVHRMGRFADALTLYNALVELDPDAPENYQARMTLYMRAGALREAVADAQECIRLKPTFVPGYLRAASIFLRLGDYAAMRKQLDEGKAIAGDRGGAALEMAYDRLDKAEKREQLACDKLESGEYEEALNLVEANLRMADLSPNLQDLRNQAVLGLARRAVSDSAAPQADSAQEK